MTRSIFYVDVTKTISFFSWSRLIINLTSPTSVIFNEQIPTERLMYSVYQQIISYLQEYKAALTDDSAWSTVAGRFGTLLNIVSVTRS